MNFNYNSNNFVHYEFKGKKVEQKVKEEEKKQEELKRGESVLPETVQPEPETVTASALDVMANYFKAEIKKAEEPQGPRSGEGVDALIEEWNNLPEDATKEEKMTLLGRIIDLYEAQGDIDSAKIWRLRRFVVARDYNANLEIWNNNVNNGDYTEPITNFSYPEFHIDQQVFSELQNLYNIGQSSDEEKIIYYEYWLSCATNATLIDMIWLTNPNATPQQRDAWRSGLPSRCQNIIDGLSSMAQYVGLYSNADWQDTFATYKTMYTQLQQDIQTSGMSQSEIADRALDLQSIVEELRRQGFPYCEQLLLAIQALIVYSGSNEPNLLGPNPESTQGTGDTDTDTDIDTDVDNPTPESPTSALDNYMQPQYAGEDWYNILANDYLHGIQKLYYMVTHPDIVPLEEVRHMVDDLQVIIAKLTEQGFPDIEALLEEIQRYLDEGGFDINILPPQNGDEPTPPAPNVTLKHPRAFS